MQADLIVIASDLLRAQQIPSYVVKSAGCKSG